MGKTVGAMTRKYAEYVLVFTTLPDGKTISPWGYLLPQTPHAKPMA